tara:strand:+ start:80 stop:388 length:309 start_codon:yes stop_codon:yes gene_type:complete
MRNTPLKAFAKKSPVRLDWKGMAKGAMKVGKPLLKGAAKRATGLAGAFLGAVKTASADQPGTGGHGGKTIEKSFGGDRSDRALVKKLRPKKGDKNISSRSSL